MKKLRITIGNKILLSFVLLILIFVISAIVSYITVKRNDKSADQISEIIDPSKDRIEELRHLATKSKMLITNWVYLQSNTSDKDALREQHLSEYPNNKEELLRLKESWVDQSERDLLDSALNRFDALIEVEKGIMSLLVEFEDYEDPINKFAAEDSIESVILPQSAEIITMLDQLSKIKKDQKDQSNVAQRESSDNLVTTIIVLAIISIAVGVTIALLIARSITVPINSVKETILLLSRGVLPKEKSKSYGKDEIGEMSKAMDQLVSGLNATSTFAESIGNGDYDASFEPLSNDDVLGNSLLEMRFNLKKVSDEDRKRNWSTEGLATFGDILRKNIDDLEQLTDKVLSGIVKYMGANQGGLFVINDENPQDVFLELSACYAWDTKKYLEDKIYIGDGLNGQTWLEKKTKYLTHVPDSFVNITSGLGQANPRCLLIVPLKVNDVVYGVLEIASFEEYQEYQIEFVEKIAESIASTISSAKINQRTQKLLEESNQSTDRLQTHEEQMRQNMEELQATQEEMERNQREQSANENILNTTQMMIRLNEDFEIVRMNDLFRTKLHYKNDELAYKKLGQIVSEEGQGLYEEMLVDLKNDKSYLGVFKLIDGLSEEMVVQVACGPVTDQLNNERNYAFFISEVDMAKVL